MIIKLAISAANYNTEEQKKFKTIVMLRTIW